MTEQSESRPAGVERPELHPGGADSIDDPEKYGDTPGPPATRDLPPEDNPAVDDVLPDEIAEPDDKSQEPDTGTSGEDDTEQESPA
jgi:hypothetical protein